MKYLDQQQIKDLLPMTDCIAVMRNLFSLDPEKDLINPLRPKMMLPNGGILGMMPASILPYGVMGIKIISVYLQNYEKGLSSHQGIIHLFDAENGMLLLSMDADEVTAIRTAAVSALMTDLLAENGAETLCLIGTGTQAITHLEAIRLVRPIKRVQVWSKNQANVVRFVQEQSAHHDVEILACSDAENAVRGADIVCTLTSSAEPLVFNPWLKPGVHINAVGASTPNYRELAPEIIFDADVFVDNYESAVNEAGDLILAVGGKTKVRPLIKGDIHAVLSQPGLVDKSHKTLFKSLGLAIEDIAVAHYCWQKIS
ncbi:MAG: ornithine cyclodeaminase family protein [Haliscomenobacter sp.]|uniref:ornithine cyclodeaminase family protein n=1 Tax=Haliscomenobacter sp. TaxID=2717303 RepID=UPI0029B009B9|nr:ornithine cyclodeaminase family protein [Haliscomenobacter sp.]MDX2067571.1 ornithine cyclodeaminase family protein [Haliscomenobacter sp.]